MQTPHTDRPVRIHLTPEQQQQLKETVGREADSIELTVRELEERIMPRIAFNHNETLLGGR